MRLSHSYLFLVIALIWGCKNEKAVKIDSQIPNVVETPNKMRPENRSTPFFKAEGINWKLQISEANIKFKSEQDGYKTFDAPTTQPVYAQDANIKFYKSETESGIIMIYVYNDKCSLNSTNTDYKVTAKIKRGIDTEFTGFEGCGTYLLNNKLDDLWVLESLGGNPISAEQFREDLPRIEINSSNKTFSGYGGCNQLRGQIFSEGSLIRFTDIIATKMLCAPPNKENDFLLALRSTTAYQLENWRLLLSNPNGPTLSFKKMN